MCPGSEVGPISLEKAQGVESKKSALYPEGLLSPQTMHVLVGPLLSTLPPKPPRGDPPRPPRNVVLVEGMAGSRTGTGAAGRIETGTGMGRRARTGATGGGMRTARARARSVGSSLRSENMLVRGAEEVAADDICGVVWGKSQNDKR